MKIRIQKLPAGLIRGDTFEPVSFSEDPTGRYAVAELFANEFFAAVRILLRGERELLCEYVDGYSYQDFIPMLLKFSVQWDCIRYGFCKLTLWAPEAPESRDGIFERTVKRFYFDRELYRKCREEINGVPGGREEPDR